MNNLYERLHNIDTQIKELYRQRELVQRQIDMESQINLSNEDYMKDYVLSPYESKKLQEDWDKVLEDSGRLFG
jgi:hypothetical protein